MNAAEFEAMKAKNKAASMQRSLQKIRDVLGEEALRRVLAMTSREQMMGIGNTLTFLARDIFPEAPDPHMDRIVQEACDWMNSQL